MADRSLFALSFIEEPLDVTSLRQIDRDPTFDDELRRLEHELLEGQKRWRESIEDLETTYEELQAADEELHAVNDELVDLSREARVRAVDLQAVNADLANIEQLLTQGLVLLDADLLVTRFSPLAVRLFALVAADIGRSLLDVPTTLRVPGLAEALSSILGGGDRVNIECVGADQSFLVQVLPYVAAPGARRGAIVALTDISEQATLRQAAERARGSLIRIASALQEVVWQRDVDTGELLFVSSQVLQLSGWTSEEVLVRPGLLDECVDEQDRDAVRAARRTADEAWSVTYRFNPREGGQRWVLESGTKARDNERVTLVASLMDITDRRGAETAAAQASLVFESVFSTDLFGVAVLDADEKIVLANDTLAEWVGRSADSLVGQRISELSQPAPEGHELVTGELQMARSVSRILHQNGSKRWVTIDSRPLCGGAEAGVAIAVVQDATGLLEARHDAMTGLLNRKSVWEALELDVARADRSNRQVSLLCIDIDRFKEINDRDGHEAGDLVLGAFAQRVKSVVRTHEATGRLGGDEFAVVLSDYESEGALEATIERILAAIREPIVVGGVEFALSGSIGVAQFPQDATCAEDLMRAADTAMYQAKARGGDRFEHFQHSMTVLADRRLQIRQDMVKAVEDHDFEMYYQPIVAVDDSVWGVEALVRWNRGGEVVVASEFISATESSGQMRSLGTVVFGLLGTDVELMCAAGFVDVPISVNMSTTQLEDPALTSLLTAWPAATGMTNVVLEVTESVFLPNHSRARRVLERLTQFGADVCVDDFGSGFSNLSLLRELSPAFTKLDRMFLADPVAAEAGRTQGDAEVATELVDRAHSAQIALMTSAIEMGHALGAKVVVAGIETRDQRDLATRLGADFLQGFAIAEPMPMPELVRWLKDRSGTA
ncbi:MAG: EAL domain-containing protein [Candidatus Nanopelagicales bacterium]|nr:EAL domain-containing protein [Candidatus Nanopelagicales bacterium]